MDTTKLNLSDLRASFSDGYDLFICSSSFEDRCLSIASNIDLDHFSRSLVLSNVDLKEYVGRNEEELLQILGDKGRISAISTIDPILTADSLVDSLSEINSKGNLEKVLIDVSSFTHESLLILLKIFTIFYPKTLVNGVYANASEYSVGDDIKHKWLSRGVGEVRTILGYPGKITPSRKNHLILIVGYEYERAAGIIESLEPNSISLGYGRPSTATTEKDQSANEHYMHLVEQVATSFTNVNCFEVPCDNPFESCKIIKQQVDKFEDMNIILAPMNNKLSTIGAAMAVFENDSVQLCYAKALQYNYSNYSSPGNKCYLFPIFQ
jgi:hypothetical protein